MLHESSFICFYTQKDMPLFKHHNFKRSRSFILPKEYPLFLYSVLIMHIFLFFLSARPHTLSIISMSALLNAVSSTCLLRFTCSSFFALVITTAIAAQYK